MLSPKTLGQCLKVFGFTLLMCGHADGRGWGATFAVCAMFFVGMFMEELSS